MADRISALTTHARTLRDITLTQIDLAKVNHQISSGKRASSYDELSGAVERVSANQSKISRIDNYISNNKAVSTTLSAMDNSLDQIQKALEDFSSNLVLRRGAATSEQMNFPALAQEALDLIAGALNQNVGGRYIFSGTKTDVKPVDDNIYLNETGVPDDSYYNGNSESMTARISDSRTLDFGVTGNDAAFQKAFAAIVTAQTADANNESTEFDQAVNLLNEAISEITNVRAKVNSNIASVEAASSEHASMKIYWKQALADDLDTDVAEASIRLAADQTILQATYQVFALTSKLKLSDYL
jgi:flagellar hook-associated protein 3 FlgL